MVKENMDETNSGYSKHVGGLKIKKINDKNFEYHAEVKEIHLNTAGMAHGGFLTFIADTGMGNIVQFERQGYFCLDPDSSDDTLVFNRTVALRDSWAKAKKK